MTKVNFFAEVDLFHPTVVIVHIVFMQLETGKKSFVDTDHNVWNCNELTNINHN